jgi:hypothetical protein
MTRRRMSRRKKTGIFIASVGVASGLLAVILWPKVKAMFLNPTITVGQPTITQTTNAVAALLEG